MQPIKTGNTYERLIRNGIFTAMVVFFSAYSFYDWKIGYPNDNLGQARQEIPPAAQDQAGINNKVWTERVAKFSQGDNVEAIKSVLGPPAWEGKMEADNGRTRAVWFGPAISFAVQYGVTGHLLDKPAIKESKHSETDLVIQAWMGIVLGAFGVILLMRMAWILAYRAKLSEAGLKITGKPCIPFDAMIHWDLCDYQDAGRIRLYYTHNGKTSEVVLDDYKLREFSRMVEIISQRRSFENPTSKT